MGIAFYEFFISLELQALTDGVSLVRNASLFYLLAPQYAKDIWPLLVFYRRTMRPILELLKSR